MDRSLRWRCAWALALALAASACSTLAPSPLPADDCTRWFEQLDAAVNAAGVRDAQDTPIEGFAGLRVDRFGQATRDSLAPAAWIERAAMLDRDARAAELANLPPDAFPIGAAANAQAARERSDACRERLRAHVAADPAARRALLDRATVPERYATPLRAIGLYPLLRWPFFAGVSALEVRHRHVVERWSAAPPPLQRFVPADDDDVPLAFEIELQRDGSLAAFDRFGVPTWSERAAAAAQIDTAQPVVYRRRANALYGGRVLRQDVFTLWFPERPSTGRFDLLAGALDGVIVRLTYGPDGTPWMLDTVHACGCYHMFFPTEGVRARDDAPRFEEWAFVPAPLPPRPPGRRWVVRIASGTHYVSGLALDGAAAGSPQRFTLRDEDELRSLPAGSARRSLYGPDGLVAGSERGERFLFWPMGIGSAGAMRQWGHHATAFVGRRHFDDPNLLAERFVLPIQARP